MCSPLDNNNLAKLLTALSNEKSATAVPLTEAVDAGANCLSHRKKRCAIARLLSAVSVRQVDLEKWVRILELRIFKGSF